MAFFYSTEKNKRASNEDRFCQLTLRVNHEASVCAMVLADGMGGLESGEKFSGKAVELFCEALLKTIMGEEFKGSGLTQQAGILWEFQREIFEKINRILYKTGLDAGKKGGTTLTAALRFWDTWMIANCGDSPVYGRLGGEWKLLSEIQNVAGQLVREGKTGRDSVLYLQNKNRLLQYLGRREAVRPFLIRIPAKEMDVLLLGSDGAFGDLSLPQIREVCEREENASDWLGRLFELSRYYGEEDNQTAILYVREDRRPPRQEASKEKPEKTPDLPADAAYQSLPAEGAALRGRWWRDRFKGGRR